mgnify:CR=1 FL=1
MLKAIHVQDDKEAARRKAVLVAEKLRTMKLERIASFVETCVETLSYMNFPYEHWSRLRTNNGLKRIMKEIRRRTRGLCNEFSIKSQRVPVRGGS